MMMRALWRHRGALGGSLVKLRPRLASSSFPSASAVATAAGASACAAFVALDCRGTACEEVIEVEKKLFLTAAQREGLVSSVLVRREAKFWDVYYDSPKLALTTKDWWLRQREGTWELKIPWTSGQALSETQTYEEVVEEVLILRKLREQGVLPGRVHGSTDVTREDSLAIALSQNSIEPFARVHTHRVSLQVCDAEAAACGARSIHVDLDSVTFDGSFAEPDVEVTRAAALPFIIAEVEVLAPKDQGAVSAAVNAVDSFLSSRGLLGAPKAYSKLIEYLLRFRPGHLASLSDAGIVPREKLKKLQAAAAALRPA